MPVRYEGVLPDPFRAGREVIVNVRKQGGVFIGEKDSLITKCPSKFTAEKTPDPPMLRIAGKACLIIALAVCVYGIGASLYGARSGGATGCLRAARRSTRWRVRRRLAFVILEAAFLRSDFTFALVTSHSSTTTPAFYRATAVWSSQEGSLLLWLLLLSLWSSLILFITRRRLREIAPYATAVLLGLAAFFACLLVFLESPFDRTIGPVPPRASASTRCCGTRA